MLVSHEKRFIYLKCGRTASTSTEAYFQPYCGDTELLSDITEISPKGIVAHSSPSVPGTQFYDHMEAQELKCILGDDTWYAYFKFANVRNPFDVVVSNYFDQAISCKEELSFETWWQRRRPFGDSMWSVITIDDQIAVNDVIRYENLLEDVGRVCEALEIGFDAGAFPGLRAEARPSRDGRKYPYEKIITEASLIEDIQIVFERTFTEYGYRY